MKREKGYRARCALRQEQGASVLTGVAGVGFVLGDAIQAAPECGQAPLLPSAALIRYLQRH